MRLFNYCFKYIQLILILSWALGCGNNKSQPTVDPVKHFYIYTTGLACNSSINTSRMFKEFISVHSNILKHYYVHIVHYDPDFSSSGVRHWEGQFESLPLEAEYDQLLKTEYFQHDAKEPHIVLDGAGIYDQKVHQVSTVILI